MKMFGNAPFFGMVVAGALSAFGGTWYADASKADNTGDGLSEATAKKYIQSAVDLAEESSDAELKVVVLPGYYDDASETLKPVSAKDTQLSRVLISKPMTLVSRDGKDATHIVGRYGTETGSNLNLGDTSARCITIAASGAGTIVEGFTIRDGATKVGNQGGGIYCTSQANDYILGCTFRDCIASYGGAIEGGSAARCLFMKNDYRSDHGIVFRTGLSNCIFLHNFFNDRPYLGSQNPYVVNCTQVGNGGWRTPRRYSPVLGCIILGNKYNGFTGADAPGTDYYKAKYWGLVSNCVISATSITVSGPDDGKFEGNNRFGAEKTNLVSTLTFDLRPLPALGAEARADFSDLELYTSDLPEAYRYKDYNGNAIVADANGKITAGAIQEIADPATLASGYLTVEEGFDTEFGKITSYEGEGYARSTNWPAQVWVKYDEADFCCYRYKYNGNYYYHYPNTDNEAWVTIPSKGYVATKLEAVLPNDTLYVDASAAEDYDGKAAVYNAETGHGPKQTIQGAIDAATIDNTLIWVAPGTYATGGKEVDGLMSRVAIVDTAVYVRSTDGASVTTIQGAADSTSEIGGYGTGATRCVGIKKRGMVMGFTLTGGYTKAPRESDADYASFGGGVYALDGKGDSAYGIVDCVITGNKAGQYGISYGGVFYRSRIGGCDVYRKSSSGSKNFGETSGSKFVSCIFNQNSGEGVTFRNGSSFFNCTVDGGTGNSVSLFENNVTRVNSALYYCGSLRSHRTTHYFWGNAVLGSKFNNILSLDDTTVLEYGTDYYYVTNQFIFANPAAYDYRSYVGAELAGAGRDLSKSADCWIFSCGDFNNDPLVIVDGNLTPGAVQTFHDRAVYISNTGSNATIVNGTEGWNSLLAGDITISATKANRPFRGFKVDGEWETHATSKTLGSDFSGTTLEVVSSPDWYANANAETSGDGMSPETAVKTLKEAMELPLLAGDTVHAARGDYNSGTMRPDPAAGWYNPFYNKGDRVVNLDSRVMITNDITLVADEGRDVTFISGKAADDPDEFGLGAGAVRCVMITSHAVIENFTIRNGHTRSHDDGYGTADDDVLGGALLATAGGGNGTLKGCIIENCAAVRGTCNTYGTLVNCIVRNCQASGDSCAGYVGYFHGTYFDHLRMDGNLFLSYRGINNCTIGPDVKMLNGNDLSGLGYPNDTGANTKIRNTLSLANSSFNSTYTNVYLNCRFIDNDNYRVEKWSSAVGPGTRFFTDLDDAKVDANCICIPGGGSTALGTADQSLTDFDKIGQTDVNGNLRFSNNGMDIGAQQSVWNAYYAKKLGYGLACPSVSPTAYAVTDGVCLNDGEITLQTRKELPQGRHVLAHATVTGNGTLKVYNGDTLCGSYTADKSPISFDFVTAQAGIPQYTFKYESVDDDPGSAFLTMLTVPYGTVISIR